MYGIALVGAGRIGRIHAGNVAAHPALRLRYVIDPAAASASQIAQATGATVGSLAEALSDPEIAGVIVASSTDTHLDFTLAAIGAGKAVFCEKPIDLDLGRVLAAGQTLGGADVPLLMGFNRRFDPHFRELGNRVRSGAMGDVETLHIISHDPAPPPIDYVRVSGGLFRDMTIHDFDMARWLLGEEPTELYAAASNLVDPAIGAAGDVDTAKVLMRTASGRICQISNSRRSGYGYDQRIEVYCARGLVRAGNVSETTVETWGADGPQHAPFMNFFLDRYASAYAAEMDHFAGILDGSEHPAVGYQDALAALALADAAAESARTGTVVRHLPPPGI